MIGIFDSGLGGLTVAKAIRGRLPEYPLWYVGDTARLPYGNRSADQIYRFTTEGVGFLFDHGCPLVVVACNTASAVALRRLQHEWLPEHFPDRRVLGVIRPVAEFMPTASPSGRVGVVGTVSTVNSGAYVRELTAANASVRVFQQACPLLVPLIEEGWGARPETAKRVREYVRPLQEAGVDALVLGCTHYPMIRSHFTAAMGEACAIPDPAAIVADKLADYLRRHSELERRLVPSGASRYFVTDKTVPFGALAAEWLGEPVPLELVQLAAR